MLQAIVSAKKFLILCFLSVEELPCRVNTFKQSQDDELLDCTFGATGDRLAQVKATLEKIMRYDKQLQALYHVLVMITPSIYSPMAVQVTSYIT